MRRPGGTKSSVIVWPGALSAECRIAQYSIPDSRPGLDFYELIRQLDSAKGVTKMLNRFMGLLLVLVAVLNFSSLASGQTARPQQPGAVQA